MMNLLVTGASGMLGTEVCKVLSSDKNFNIFSTSRSVSPHAHQYMAFDLLNPTYSELFNWAKPEAIIHCAAMTSIDECEINRDIAYAVNVGSVEKILTEMSQGFPRSRLFFISSDAVKAEGQSMATESCLAIPLNYYGETKRAAEKTILSSPLQCTAIRTTIVGSKKNLGQISFVDSIMNNAKKGSISNLFEDVIFTPISCRHLAETIGKMLSMNFPKILNIAGAEAVSKYDFGCLLLKEMGFDSSLINRVKLNEAHLKAARVHDQTLSSALFNQLSGISSPTVIQTIRELLGAQYA